MSHVEPLPLEPGILRREFPILDNMIYANHAAMSPWPLTTRQAVEAFACENAERGPLYYAEWLKLETGLRERLARMLNAPSGGDIGLLSNTTDGVNIVARGLDWQRGDNIVTPAGEFPTNQLAWQALGDLGVELRQVDIRAARDPETALLDRVDHRTRVMTVSAVQWDHGFRLDLARLGAGLGDACLFFVDAIQQFGAMPLDVRACAIDCLAAGSHKWQMGPEGMGIFYCRDSLRESLRLSRHGWRMLDDPYRFERPDRAPSASARRFEAGSPNTMGQVALDASLSIIEQYGQQQVAKAVLANSRAILELVDVLPGLEAASNIDADRISGIVSIHAARTGVSVMHRALKLRQVVCAVRNGAIRLSPHFYQHDTQLEQLLEALEFAAKDDKTD